jgi:Tubulin binding cofactor A
MAEIRNLGIKTGSVRRLGKEMVMYREEEQREQTKVQKMKAENADQYDLKHAVRRGA